MNVNAGQEKPIVGFAVVCAVAVALYRAATGQGFFSFSVMSIALAFPLVVVWFMQRDFPRMTYDPRAVPAIPEPRPMFGRFSSLYVAAAALVWIGWLVSMSVPEIPSYVESALGHCLIILPFAAIWVTLITTISMRHRHVPRKG